MLHFAQGLNYLVVVLAVDVGNHVADVLVGFQVLAEDVDLVLGQSRIDLTQYTRHIVVNVKNAMCAFLWWHTQGWNGMRTDGNSSFEILQLL